MMRVGVVCGLLAGIFLVAGCAVRPTDHRVVRHRHMGVNYTLERTGKSFEQREPNLAETTRRIGKSIEIHAERTEERFGEHALILFY
jgi:hypothetical protein